MYRLIMKYLYLFFLIIAVQRLQAQTKKIYVTADSVYSSNPAKAIDYLLVKKSKTDTTYQVSEYDMRDTILYSGAYKDSSLLIPHGKFIYYNKAPYFSKYSYMHQNTNNYVETEGCFLNGRKSGLWVSYYPNGQRRSIETYANGKANGPFAAYSYGDGVWTEGNSINGATVGSTYMYNTDSLLIYESKVDNNGVYRSIKHLDDAEPNYDFDSYMVRKLRPYRKQLSHLVLLLRFTVSKTGNIIKPGMMGSISPEIDKAIFDALVSAPAFSPAKYDGSIIQVKTSRLLHF